jgi:hypothetical protein
MDRWLGGMLAWSLFGVSCAHALQICGSGIIAAAAGNGILPFGCELLYVEEGGHCPGDICQEMGCTSSCMSCSIPPVSSRLALQSRNSGTVNLSVRCLMSPDVAMPSSQSRPHIISARTNSDRSLGPIHRFENCLISYSHRALTNGTPNAGIQ